MVVGEEGVTRLVARTSQELVTMEPYHLLYRVYPHWIIPGKTKQEIPTHSVESPLLLPEPRDERQRHRPLWLTTLVTLLWLSQS